MTLITSNPLRERTPLPTLDRGVAGFHARMPKYSATRLVEVPRIAAALGLGRVLVKVENQRMDLPSFKILGASWATYRAVCDHLGYEPEPWHDIAELAANVAHLRPFTLATATDGNHGRAVAFMARLLGFDAHVFVPSDMAESRIRAIRDEGATVTIVDGTYDDAVRRSAQDSGPNCLIVSDTSWDGYENIPGRVIEGYSTIFAEIDDALDTADLPRPDIVVVPIGVGAFMAAAVSHFRQPPASTTIVGVEPADANCVQASALNGRPTEVPGPHNSIMVGLNCGLPSQIAWPMVSTGVDWFVSLEDDAARRAMRSLADVGIVAGETGAASLAGLEAIVADQAFIEAEANLRSKTALIVVTEGATDPSKYEEIVGQAPSSVAQRMSPI